MEIRIDPEFKALIPPLTAEERRQLEENLKADGCRDALVLWQGTLVDGHNRYEICTEHGIPYETADIGLEERSDVLLWIIRNQLGRRNLTDFTRVEIANKLREHLSAQAKERQGRRTDLLLNSAKGSDSPDEYDAFPDATSPIDTVGEVAKAAGVGRDTARKAIKVIEKAPEEIKQNLRAGESSIHAEYTKIVKEEKEQAKEQRKAELIDKAAPLPEDTCRLIVSRIEDLHEHIEPHSLDAIITDPPYGQDALELYEHLARFAFVALKPFGSLLVMTGQSYLPEIMQRLGYKQQLTYHWTLSYLTPGGQSPQIWSRKVNTFWKPVFWYVKGEYAGDWHGDVIKSAVNDNDKRFHGWGQSESGMVDLVEKFTEPGDTVCDPFLGGGTTAVVSLRLGRRFVGADIEKDNVSLTSGRLHESVTL